MNNSVQSKMITGVLLVVACLGVGYFFTTTEWDNYSTAKMDLSSKQANNTQLNQALSNMQNFVTQYESHQTDLANVNLALPAKSPDLGNLLNTLSSMAQSSGLTMSNLAVTPPSTDKPVPTNTIQTTTLNLTATGSYESFKDFLMRLETDLRILDVDHITIKAGTQNQIDYSMTIRAYYQQ